MRRPLPLGGGLAHAPHPPLLLDDLQSLDTPHPLYALAVDFMPFTAEQRGEAQKLKLRALDDADLAPLWRELQ
jgi:hypothetical protein